MIDIGLLAYKCQARGEALLAGKTIGRLPNCDSRWHGTWQSQAVRVACGPDVATQTPRAALTQPGKFIFAIKI